MKPVYTLLKGWLGVLLVALCCTVPAAAQIGSFEYFFDTDPGPGNAIPVTSGFTPGNSVTFSMNIPVTGLPPGFHQLFFRAKLNNILWSQYQTRTFYLATFFSGNGNLAGAEYFFDTDPGLGNGTAITLPNASLINQSVSIPVTGLAAGFHQLNIRVKNTSNTWSHYQTRAFYISAAPAGADNITGAEYFFDTDPGNGHGTAIPLGPSALINQTLAIPVTGTLNGFHQLFIRTKNASNTWSHYQTRSFFVTAFATANRKIAGAEYFIDTDPGNGNGTPITINPPVDTASQIFPLNIPASVPEGLHMITIRVRNEQGQWSHYQSAAFGMKTPKPGSGYALSFDGSDDYVSMPGYAVPGTGDFTVDFWVFNRSNAGYREFISQGAGGSAFYIGLDNSSTGAIRCGDGWQNTGAVLPLNQWVHVALTKSGTDAALYLNGIQAATTTGYTIGGAGDFTRLGRQYNGNGEFADAELDEMRIWNAALSQAQIRDRMCRKVTATDPLYSSLLSYFNFDEHFGTTLYDGKGAQSGTLLNGPAWTLSGAPIGNVSAHSYAGAAASVNLAHPTRGDDLTATLTGGAADGVQVYCVTDTPNNIAGTTCLGSNNGYYGVFAVNGTNPTYDAVYNYDGIYLNSLNESQIRLFRRRDNSATNWTDAMASLDTLANTITTPDTPRGEYIVSNAVVTPAVTITVSPNDTICGGTAVTFTAAITNGGASPAFQWKKNGINTGANTSTYTDNSIVNGDVITCQLTSSSSCVSPAIVTSAGITMTVTTGLTASVSAAASPGNTICAGTPVLFTATPVNGGPSPAFQWKVNGTAIGGNANTFNSSTLANGDVVTVDMNTSASCAGPATVTSTGIVMIVNPLVTPTVSIASNPGNAVCSGTPVTFTATITNGGSAPVYQWQKNGVAVGTNAPSYTDNGLNNNDNITCALSSSATCATPVNVVSNTITMAVSSSAPATVTISGNPGNTICAGTSVTFTAAPGNGGVTPSYQWKKNGNNVGNNSQSYTDNGLLNNDIITVVLTGSNACSAPQTATSNAITMTVNPIAAPAVSIASSGGTTVCSGVPVTFTASAANGGPSPSFQWKKNGGNVGNNSSTYVDNSLATGDIITAVLTSSYTCASPATATSNAITMTLNPLPVVSAGPDQTILQGSSVALSATGGSQYSWSTGDTTASIVVAPGVTTSYIVSTTNGFGCTASDTVVVTVNFSSLSVAPGSYNFGNVVVNASATANITVTNNGTLPVTINSAAISAPFSTTFTAQSVSPGNSVNIPVSFTPAGTLIYQGTLTINTGIGSFTVITQGRGVSAAPAWTVTPNTWNFGNVTVGDSFLHAFILNNTGNVPITISSITTNNIAFAGGGGASTIPVGGSTGFQIKFKPAAITSYNGIVTVNTTTPGLSPISVIVSGTGYIPGALPVLMFVNTPPYNGTSGVNPSVAPAGPFTYSIVYKHINNIPPMAGFPKVGIDLNADGDFIDGGEGIYTMSHVGSGANWTGGETYTFTQNLPNGSTYGYKFFGQDSLGNTATSVNAAYVSGPVVTNQSLDLSIYANDITFSNNNPAVGQQFTVSAVVHNNSPFSASNVPIRFYKDSVFLTSTILPFIGPNTTATITQNFTFSPDGFYPIKVWIDSAHTLPETNVLNNYALRPVIVGHFTVPGAITTTHTAVTASCPGTSVFISGNATYSGLNLVGTPPVLGGTVTVQIAGGPTLTTNTVTGGYWSVYYGGFSCSQNYSYTVTVTDYTLTGTTAPAIYNAPCQTCASSPGGTFAIGGGAVGSCIRDLVPFFYNITLNNSCNHDTARNDTTYVYADNVLAYTHNQPLLTPCQTISYSDAFTLGAGFHTLSFTNVYYDSTGRHQSSQSNSVNVEQALPDLALGNFSQSGPTAFNVSDINTTCINAGAHKVFLYDSTATNNGPVLLDSFAVAGVGGLGAQSLLYSNPGFSMGYHYLKLVADVYNSVPERNENNNELRAILYVPFPELTISDITTSATNLAGGTVINFSAVVHNTGSTAGAFKVQFLAAGVPIGNKIQVSGLAGSGASSLVVSDPYTVPFNPCPVLITAVVDVDAQVAELLETNNRDSMILGTDLVSGVPCSGLGSACNPYVVIKNQPHQFFTTVSNTGSRDAGNVAVKFSLGAATIGSDNIAGIPAQSLAATALFHTFTAAGNYVIGVLPDSANAICEIDEGNNAGAIYVSVVDGLPDLEILSQHISPSNLNPNINQTVSVVASVFNKGNQSSAPCVIRFWVDNVQLGADIPIDSIGPGGDTTVAATATYSGPSVGPKIIKVKADALDLVTEIREDNNTATRAIIVGGAPDLARSIYEGITIAGTLLRRTEAVLLRNYLRNYGGDSGKAWLKYYITDNAAVKTLIDSVQFTLQPNDSAIISAPWLVSFAGSGVVTTEIAHSVPQEFNELNNTDTLAFTAGPKLKVQIGTADSALCLNGRLSLHSTVATDNQSVSYGWYHSGAATGATLPDSFVIANVSLADSGLYELRATDFFGTVTAAAIHVTVHGTVVPVINITANPGNTICAGTSVRFTAAVTSGGTAPTYQWMKNGINVGTNAPKYTDFNLVTGDVITCGVVSNAACATLQPANSNSITMAVNALNGALATSTASQTYNDVDSMYLNYTDNNCRLIASITTMPGSDLGPTTATTVINPALTSFVKRFTEITPSHNLPAAVKLYFLQTEFNDYNQTAAANGLKFMPVYPSDPAVNNIVIYQYHGLPSAGTTGPGGQYNASNVTVIPSGQITKTWNSITNYWEISFQVGGFSGHFLRTEPIGTPLKIRLGNINAVNMGSRNVVSWETVAEDEGDYFVVERSINGKDFTPVATIGGREKPSSYNYPDNNPVTGVNYYRLRMYEKDGKSEYSPVVQAYVKKGSFAIEVFPIPVKDLVTVTTHGGGVNGRIRITDVAGSTVREVVVTAVNTSIDMSGLAPGVYFVKYADDEHAQTVRVVKE